MFKTEQIQIKICMGSSCFASGNSENLDFIESYIKKENLNANIELIGSRCDGKCPAGPNIFINNIEYNGVTVEKLKKILEGFSDE